MKMNFTMFFLFFVLFVSFLQFAQCQPQTCSSKDVGNCATLNCLKCTKRLCLVQEKGLGTATLTAAITVPICVLLLLVATVFLTMKWLRSSQRGDRDSRKSSNLSVKNSYYFGRRPSSRVSGPPKVSFSSEDNVYENDADLYEYIDIANLRGKDNPTKVTDEGEVSADGGYEIPNPPLGKPNFPPPHIPDSPT